MMIMMTMTRCMTTAVMSHTITVVVMTIFFGVDEIFQTLQEKSITDINTQRFTKHKYFFLVVHRFCSSIHTQNIQNQNQLSTQFAYIFPFTFRQILPRFLGPLLVYEHYISFYKKIMISFPKKSEEAKAF